MTVYTTERGLHNDSLNNIGRRAHAGCMAGWDEMEIPESLVHYTTMKGMASIVAGQSIYASHPRYLNDYTETRETHDLYSRARESVDSNSDASIFFEALDALLDRSPVPNYYVACFCRDDDLLSQWRGYGAGGGRAPAYALTFDRLELSSMTARGSEASDIGGHPIMLLPVIYDETRKSGIFSDILAAALEAWNSGDREDAAWAADCADATRAALAVPSALFKNPAFSEEDEWRFIFVRDHGESLRAPYRETDFGLCPYVELRHRNRLPLTNLRQGPTPYPADALRSAEAFLRHHGYNVDVSASTATLR